MSLRGVPNLGPGSYDNNEVYIYIMNCSFVSTFVLTLAYLIIKYFMMIMMI